MTIGDWADAGPTRLNAAIDAAAIRNLCIRVPPELICRILIPAIFLVQHYRRLAGKAIAR
jgi:hypothetical protein